MSAACPPRHPRRMHWGAGREDALRCEQGLARLHNTAQLTAHPEAGTAPYTAPECFTDVVVMHKGEVPDEGDGVGATG